MHVLNSMQLLLVMLVAAMGLRRIDDITCEAPAVKIPGKPSMQRARHNLGNARIALDRELRKDGKGDPVSLARAQGYVDKMKRLVAKLEEADDAATPK